MSDLFPEVRDDPSPRLRWQREFIKHRGVKTWHTEGIEQPWCAWIGKVGEVFGPAKSNPSYAQGETEAEALEKLAAQVNFPPPSQNVRQD